VLRPTSALSAHDLDRLRRIVAGRPLFRLYLDAALDDLARGRDDRLALVGEDGEGAVLGIVFDGLAVLTAIGRLRPDELAAAAATPLPAELHLEPEHEPPLAALCAPRLIAARDLVVYGRPAAGAAPDPDARTPTRADAPAVAAFMGAHNPRTVFSGWMLDLPFAALADADGSIAATAGTIASAGGSALIGNFLTRPDLRGRGLARRLALHMAWMHGAAGAREVLLATTADNAPARRAYEAAGFRLLEERRQWDLAAAVPDQGRRP
jgi:ribosomal protein S18 acetylase RimI-like enzyme